MEDSYIIDLAIFDFMYILVIRDQFLTKFFGPYPSTQNASNDAFLILKDYPENTKWQIKSLELPISNQDNPSEFDPEKDLQAS